MNAWIKFGNNLSSWNTSLAQRDGARHNHYLQICKLCSFAFEKAKGKCVVVPDILSILQHWQTDGALLISVQLLIIQTHLQVLGYSLQRERQTEFNYWSVPCSRVLTMCYGRLWVSQPRQKEKSHLIMLCRNKRHQEWNRLNYIFSLTKYQMIWHSDPEYLGHIQCRHLLKFIPRTYLQTAGWVIPRLELCTLQTCPTNLLTEISLTFELLWESRPSFTLHSLILSTQRSIFHSRL